MSVNCECCVLSGRGLCDKLIIRPEESYRLWCVVECDLETSRMRGPWPALGRRATLGVGGRSATWGVGTLTAKLNTTEFSEHYFTKGRTSLRSAMSLWHWHSFTKSTKFHSTKLWPEYTCIITISNQREERGGAICSSIALQAGRSRARFLT